MSFFLVGAAGRGASLGVREKLFLASGELPGALSSLSRLWPLKGAVVLSTCNRVEVYCDTDRAVYLKDLLGFLASQPLLDEFEAYEKEGLAAVEHLFSVASGLDSQVLGEREILGQVRQAYLAACEAATTSSFMNAAFERAIFVARLARRRFDLFRESPSIVSTAVEKARALSFGFEGKNIFIIGAGGIAAGLAKECSLKGASFVFVANRTFARAKEIAAGFNARAVGFDEFFGRLDEADIIFSATASKHFVLKKDIFQANRRIGRDVIIFDLAMPRDVDPDIGGLSGVQLFDLSRISASDNYSQPAVEWVNTFVREKAAHFFERNSWRLRSAYGRALWQEDRPPRPSLS